MSSLAYVFMRRMSRTFMDVLGKEAQDFALSLMAAGYKIEVSKYTGSDRDGPYTQFTITGVLPDDEEDERSFS
jgi:hypothetical protein